MSADGILALWNDCAVGTEEQYERWYQTEHLTERLAIPGFFRGRRYQGIANTQPQFFTYYETSSPNVLLSDEYRSRLNDPSPLTRSVMSNSFINMNRTVCRREYGLGDYRGSHAITVRFDSNLPAPERVQALLASLGDDHGVARTEYWLACGDVPQSATTEEQIRGGDQSIGACIFVEALRAETLVEIEKRLSPALEAGSMQLGSYHLLCELTAGDSLD